MKKFIVIYHAPAGAMEQNGAGDSRRSKKRYGAMDGVGEELCVS